MSVVLPPHESMNNSSSLFNYNPYNNYNDGFDPYLEYSEKYRNRRAFKNTFYR